MSSFASYYSFMMLLLISTATSPDVEWLHKALETVPIHLCDNMSWCVLSSRLSGVRDED